MSKHIIWSYDEAVDSFDCDYSLGDERDNLNIELCGPIAVIADLGLWDGRHRAAKFLEGKSTNIKDILYSEYHPTWYVEDGEVRCDDSHHDGTNHYFYREVLDTELFDTVMKRWIYDGFKLDMKELDRCSRSIAPDVASVYGWQL